MSNDLPIDSVDLNPFDQSIKGTRMELQLTGIMADLLLKINYSISIDTPDHILERQLTLLESYLDPYLSDKEQKKINDLDEELDNAINSFHPKVREKQSRILFKKYLEKKMKILMGCAYKQDILPGRIKTMKKI